MKDDNGDESLRRLRQNKIMNLFTLEVVSIARLGKS